MLVFVDESGDPGMKRKTGSSDLFVVAAVVFVENADAERCDAWISQCREQFFGGKRREFKFNKCCDDHRRKFLSGVREFDFLYLGFVLDKSKLWGPGFAFKEPFYKYTCKLLFENAKPYLHSATVVIDRSGNREFRQQLERYLKQKINTEKETIKRVRAEASHSNNLLQLADMVCGAIARSFRPGKENALEFRKLLREKELGVQVWPRPTKKKSR